MALPCWRAHNGCCYGQKINQTPFLVSEKPSSSVPVLPANFPSPVVFSCRPGVRAVPSLSSVLRTVFLLDYSFDVLSVQNVFICYVPAPSPYWARALPRGTHRSLWSPNCHSLAPRSLPPGWLRKFHQPAAGSATGDAMFLALGLGVLSLLYTWEAPRK